MIVVIPFSIQDHALTRKLARWMAQLGPYKEDSLYLVKDSRVTDNHEIAGILGPVFKDVTNVIYPDDGQNSWPFSANRMFNRAAKEIEYSQNPEPWLWLEPDSVPMKKGWWDALKKEFVEVAWGKHKKVFMGGQVSVVDVPLHMSGVGFYPALISQHAYEAAMANDVAWDVSAAHQIVPKAYFTQKIVHNWKHEAFKSMGEVDNLRSQHPEMVLFHSDKSGTLIDWLEREATVSTPSGDVSRAGPPAQGSQVVRREPHKLTIEGSIPSPAITDLFIKTYPADHEWLAYCLRSIEKFATGFRGITVAYDGEIPNRPRTKFDLNFVDVGSQPDGYLWQQVVKLYADIYTDAETIVYMDSDTIFTRPVTARELGNLPWIMTPYGERTGNELTWKWVTERFLKAPVEFEFMRRHPFVVPRWLLKAIKEYCQLTHGMALDQYVLKCPTRHFSEFNALGAYAYYHHHDKFKWCNTEITAFEKWPTLYVDQRWSVGGLTDAIKEEWEQILGGDASCRGPTTLPKSEGAVKSEPEAAPARVETFPEGMGTEISRLVRPLPARPENFEEGVGGSDSDEEEPEKEFPGIHQTKEGWWVIDGDERIGKWVEDEGRLDHDQWLLERILPLVKAGDRVVEAGAFIGDHTHAFLERGVTVFAFEPNVVAAECLRRNCPRARITEAALWDESTALELRVPSDNPGGAYLLEAFKNGGVEAHALDSLGLPKFDLMIIDAEGSELFVLRGAEKAINGFHPTLIIEINRFALERYGYRSDDVFLWLKEHGYEWKPIQPNLIPDPPQYDVIARYVPDSKIEVEIPIEEEMQAEPGRNGPELVWNAKRVEELVLELTNYARTSSRGLASIRKRLREAGILKGKKGR